MKKYLPLRGRVSWFTHVKEITPRDLLIHFVHLTPVSLSRVTSGLEERQETQSEMEAWL